MKEQTDGKNFIPGHQGEPPSVHSFGFDQEELSFIIYLTSASLRQKKKTIKQVKIPSRSSERRRTRSRNFPLKALEIG